MRTRQENTVFAVDEELWFGDGEDKEAESRAAASLAAVGARIVGAKPFPIAARRLDELTRNPNTRMEQVVNVLESDPALSARLLRLVNSAGYGLKVRCTSVRHAAVLVGTRRLNQVATTAAILDLFDGSSGLGMELLEHASVVGSLCRYLAVHLGLPHDELFTCGFLHDIGKLMMLDAERERYAELLHEFGRAPDQMHLAERQIFGFDHAVLGAHVLAAWNIPEPVPRVIAWHHSPARALQDTVLAGMVETLRLADLLAYVLPMQDVRLGIELAAAGDAAQYLEISEAQLAAMWPDLVMLLERSRARSHGEPELDAIVPKVEVPASLMPRSSRDSMNASARPDASKGPTRPLQEVPAHFPCSVCGKPSYGNVCSACGGQICPEHQVGQDEWCTHCAREYPRFKKTYRPSLAVRVGVGLLVGVTVAVAVVSAARGPGAGAESVGIAGFMVLALWAVVLPVAYRLWYRLLFLESRRKNNALGALSIARPHSIPIRSVLPKEALPTLAAPAGFSEKLRIEKIDNSEDPRLSVGPLSMAPLSMAPSSQSYGTSSSRIPVSSAPAAMRTPFTQPPQSLSAEERAALSMAPRSMTPVSRAPRSATPESLAPRSLSPVVGTQRSVMPVSPPPVMSAAPASPASIASPSARVIPLVAASMPPDAAEMEPPSVETLPSIAAPAMVEPAVPEPVMSAPRVSSWTPAPLSLSPAISAAPIGATPSLQALAPSLFPSDVAPQAVPTVSDLVPKASEQPGAEGDDTCTPSGHSGAHPVFKLEDDAFNSPLPRRVTAYVRKPLYACVGRPPLRPSQRPMPVRGRESA